jgi:hypothetical protein
LLDMDPLAELASKLDRPPASLAAFSGLESEQLRMLSHAIDATCERRQRLIDTELQRALPSWVPRVLRARGMRLR